MATLLQRLRNDLLEARKARCTVVPNILTPVIGDLQTAFKSQSRSIEFDDMPENEVTKVIKAHIKGASDTLALDENNVKALETMKVLSEYMPKVFTEEEIVNIISEYTKSDEYEGLGSLMKFMRATYQNRYDARMVKEIHDNIA